eukprot:TRINITY_DN3126_c0_g1_i2.p3 TRINITY_DN3126_c0_g1~~TRINITY_DN3126_c0_g1_i2.p3  ORF type:complete len:231 (+),score=4.66 TRINITY_DN3126_c0_g1_i2:100-693(+)
MSRIHLLLIIVIGQIGPAQGNLHVATLATTYSHSTPLPRKLHPAPVRHPSKKYFAYQPTCSDLKDDRCQMVDSYQNCGFCITQSYPLKGYGCPYTRTYTKQGSAKKRYATYDVEIEPECDCGGVYITEGHACPSCDTLSTQLLDCAGIESFDGETDVPQECLEALQISNKFLQDCGILNPPKPAKKVVIVQPTKRGI